MSQGLLGRQQSKFLLIFNSTMFLLCADYFVPLSLKNLDDAVLDTVNT
jgi:hypothetical protein